MLLLCSVAFLFLFALGSELRAADILRWTGCGIVQKAFMVEAVKAYQEKTGIAVSLSGGGAPKGIRDASAGQSDMGGTCRPSLPERFPAEEGNAEITMVAWDALVPIVSKDNPVNTISSADLKKVLFGEIKNWKEVGGPDKKILVVVREGNISGVGYMSRKIIFGNSEADYPAEALRLPDTGPVENKVKSDPTAIGITGISSVRKRMADGEPIKYLAVDGHEPTVANIGSGSYPYFRPVFLATHGKPEGATKAFLDWLVSDEGQKVVESTGTVSIKQGAGLKAKYKFWETTNKISNFDSIL
jgi:phosphate transport system substrate-binding protein